jgi:hypothetical protein
MVHYGNDPITCMGISLYLFLSIGIKVKPMPERLIIGARSLQWLMTGVLSFINVILSWFIGAPPSSQLHGVVMMRCVNRYSRSN